MVLENDAMQLSNPWPGHFWNTTLGDVKVVRRK